MRRFAVCLVLILVSVSAAKGVHASTECEKWLTEYRNSLAHSPAVHRVSAAHRRLHHYIHRKIAKLKKPAAPGKPRLLPARHPKPKMSREELLKRLELACGDLPGESPVLGQLEKEPVADFIPTDTNPVDLAENEPGGFIPFLAPPSYGTYATTDGGSPGFPFLPPIVGGGGRIPNPPPTGTTTNCDAKAQVSCTPPPSDGPPPLVTPEPGTLVLLLTGIPGAVKVVRRRGRRA